MPSQNPRKRPAAVYVTIPAALAARIAGLAEKEACSFDEALARLVEKGFGAMARDLDAFPEPGGTEALSPRQLAVLGHLRRGLAVKEIADLLNVSEVTVRTHVHRLRERMDCPDILKLRLP